MKSFVLICLFAAASATLTNLSFVYDSELNDMWIAYKEKFQKVYEDEEDSRRRLIWEQRLVDVTRHNAWADIGRHSYTMTLNQFSDWSDEERRLTLSRCRYKKSFGANNNNSTWIPMPNVEMPTAVDWRTSGYVTSVKDQKSCGSCWAFSAVGALEGQQKRKSGKLVNLSPQNLVDCSKGNNGCNGGWMTIAYDYVIMNNGINTEAAYPYVARDQTCAFKRDAVGARCTGYIEVPQGREDLLETAVVHIGPIAVGIDCDHEGFYYYKSGIFYDPRCRNTRRGLNHAVLVVGYGTENGQDYWLVKNSWSESWGLAGYIKMARNRNNHCGIAAAASFPMV